ncbi:MAG: glycine C-acetyltransferase [Verrucomicrobiota bacterium]
MNQNFQRELEQEIESLQKAGTYKQFHSIESHQGPLVRMDGVDNVLVLSSNNYLGLAGNPSVVQAGIDALHKYGAGTASVRFICGKFSIHQELENELAEWVGTESSLSFVSCWAATEGLVPTITNDQTVILSDELNHACIIDACRLSSKAKRTVYKHADMSDLKAKLEEFKSYPRKLVITDGVFSMEGDLAPLPDLVEICRQHNAILMVDDSHGTGVMGKTGRGVAEHFGVLGQIDIITSTLGKALGGAAGGFVAGPRSLIQYLEQKARTQLFSNALPATVGGSALEALRQLKSHPEWVTSLHENTAWFRKALHDAGFQPLEGDSAIVPVIVGETSKAIQLSKSLLKEGIFVTGFGYPVVPEGKARIRFQVSAAHTREHLQRAVDVLKKFKSEILS